jgi:hypothetical protein
LTYGTYVIAECYRFSALVLHEKFANVFGSDAILLNRRDIVFGEPFLERLIAAIDQSSIVLAIIDPTWPNPVQCAGYVTKHLSDMKMCVSA